MKTVVISEDFREFELHPPDLFKKYRGIIKNELPIFLKKWDLIDIDCPACNSEKKNIAFKKFGMNYVECDNCKSLFVSPRPSEEEISEYSRTSKAASFWKEHFYKETISSRKRVMFTPRALWIVNLTEKYFKTPNQFIDIKSKSCEFIEEIHRLNLFQQKTLLDPLIDTENSFLDNNQIQIVNQPIEKAYKSGIHSNSIGAFEVIDRISNPKEFLNQAKLMLEDNGLLFLTTSTISGFDLQILWDQSKSIFPPDHINLFSIEGITELINNCGFDIIEMSTPGQLDIEIVKNEMESNKELILPRFIKYLIENRDRNAHRAFQDYLQMFELSSHLRIAAQKR